MKLWKVVSQAQLERMESRGVLRADARYMDQYYRPYFNWLSDMLPSHIGAAPKGVRYPQWAWLQWDGAERRRPDLRALRHNFPVGAHHLLEIELAPERVQLMCLNDWVMVLNHGYLANDEKEALAFESWLAERAIKDQAPYPQEAQERIEASWRKVFNPYRSRCQEWCGSPDTESIEAVFWELWEENITSSKQFQGQFKAAS